MTVFTLDTVIVFFFFFLFFPELDPSWLSLPSAFPLGVSGFLQHTSGFCSLRAGFSFWCFLDIKVVWKTFFFFIIIIITITGRLITFLAAAKNQSYMYKALFKYLLFTIRSYVACISKSVLRRLYQTVAALGFSFSC